MEDWIKWNAAVSKRHDTFPSIRPMTGSMGPVMKNACRKEGDIQRLRSSSVFETVGKRIDVYPSASRDRPVIYLNTVSGEGAEVWKALRGMECPDFTLVSISRLKWDHDMSPWDIPPISRKAAPCTGGADDYLRLLVDEIVPRAEETTQGMVPWRGLAGYSLAGLFALYSLYRTDIFSRIASVSGSLWFPGFKEYVFSHDMKRAPTCLYLSLGDQEWKTRNPYLKSVQANMEEIYDFYRQRGLNASFHLNSGNHFSDAVQRTASGISWILGR